jgi:signal transduction histidine kinase/ligand-binding sensor domain-containing protein
VWCFLEDYSGAMWIGTSKGLMLWRDGSTKTFTQIDGLDSYLIWSIHEYRPGRLWLGTDRGLVEFKNGRIIPIEPGADVTPSFRSGVRAIHSIGDGSLWLATLGGAVRCLNLADGARQTETLSNQYVRALNGDRSGNIWAGNFYDGIVACWKAASPSTAPEKLNLGSHGVAAISSDNEGNIWFGTVGGGLIRLRERKVVTYSVGEGVPGEGVQAITGDGGEGIWATTDRGLLHLSGGAEPKYMFYSTTDGLPVNYITALHRDSDGALWIGHQFGVTRFKDGVFSHYSPANGLLEGVVHAVVRDREGSLWIGSEGGLNRFRDGVFTAYRTAQGLISDDVRFILPARDGSLWLGTVGGLSHFHFGAFTNYKSEQGLSNNYVRTIFEEEDGTLWIGTYGGGLNRLKDGRFTQVTTRDGLFDDFISQIIEDRGRFWMLSNRGICHVAARELNDFADKLTNSITCISYGVADGMKSSEGNGGSQPAGWKARDGKLWFATIKGLVSIDPRQSGAILPPVIIEQVILDRETRPLDQTIQIDPGKASLEIHYTGLSFTRPEQLRFKYRLNGLDQDWIDAGNRRIAYYSHIPPGEYLFSVIAASSDGVWNETSATMRVVVIPPFWRTWWFAGLVLLSLAGVLVFVYKRRVEDLKRAHSVQESFSRQLLESQERERQRIAAELHDGLGQSLLIIKNRVFIASNANGNREATQEQLDEINASASQAIEEVREIAYNLRPFQLERFGLTRTLHAVFSRFSEACGTLFSAEIDPIDGLFSKEDEISIYRIIQESVNNIVRHANASEASLEMKRDQREITMRIRDNGNGFTPASPAGTEAGRGGFGLTGLAERVRMLGGTCVVDSAPGRGTMITIRLIVPDGVS